MRKPALILILLLSIIALLVFWPRAGSAAEVTSKDEADVDASGRPRGIRNNNPLNLRPSADDDTNPWQGETGIDDDDGGPFLKFDNPKDGLRAGYITLGTYLREGKNTIQAILESWAKEKPGDSVADYVAHVSSETGIASDQVVGRDNIPALAASMAGFEQGEALSAWMTADQIALAGTEAASHLEGIA